MSDQNNDIEKLIRLKRYEQPHEGYFDDFLKEFQSRQRSELLQRAAHGLLFERMGTYFSGFSRGQWLYAGSAACAAVTVGFFLVAGTGSHPETQPPSVPVASAIGSDTGAAEESHLWNYANKIVFEVENDQIAERKSFTLTAEWDPPIVPTSAHGTFRNFTNTPGSADTEELPVTPPTGREL
ncbi:MAG: hypothetical protein O3C21_21155 [Verrucomicrobia bacterium]|nr:hypothetical protein [Verrucomicrobiota bacterium]